jgi:lactoylglutathione lyase/methylmalonyl-CoA/ethylmalonyl-CoA epimerase
MHHVGIILPSEEIMNRFMEMYGLEIDYRGYVDAYQSQYIFTKMNPGFSESPLEFLIPDGGVLAEFRGGKGGIHHICYEVDDVDAACAEFREKGFELLEEVCPISDKTMKINFVRPKSSFGILVEFMEILDVSK